MKEKIEILKNGIEFLSKDGGVFLFERWLYKQDDLAEMMFDDSFMYELYTMDFRDKMADVFLSKKLKEEFGELLYDFYEWKYLLELIVKQSENTDALAYKAYRLGCDTEDSWDSMFGNLMCYDDYYCTIEYMSETKEELDKEFKEEAQKVYQMLLEKEAKQDWVLS